MEKGGVLFAFGARALCSKKGEREGGGIAHSLFLPNLIQA